MICGHFKIESGKSRSFIKIRMQRGIKINLTLRVFVIVPRTIRIGCWMRMRNYNTICINMGMFILY